ncbi:type II toxin-antitoxin system CcdA family antitoxin [uncultured Devosia sp.]|uniref:type II toxin-antitoxin system CcdA family antitoxin n=1 Tax=uncultured Devosia sp. TaxID=211434 RepID=UPI0035C9FC8E
MATSLRKDTKSRLTRDEMVKILDLPAAAFRAAKANMTEAELDELRRVWQEESVEAIRSSNEYVEKYGLPLERYRQF